MGQEGQTSCGNVKPFFDPQIINIPIRNIKSAGGKIKDTQDLQIAYADLGRRPDTIPGLCSQTHNPRTRIVDVNLCITRMNCRQSNAVPASEFNEVFDR
jgi:hypothetical protein